MTKMIDELDQYVRGKDFQSSILMALRYYLGFYSTKFALPGKKKKVTIYRKRLPVVDGLDNLFSTFLNHSSNSELAKNLRQ